MSRLASINLIAVFDFYLMLTFVLSTLVRYRQYRTILGFIVAVPQRWPKLLGLAKRHRTVFLTWPTLLPIAITFSLMLVHTLAYNWVWPTARVSPRDVAAHGPALVAVVLFGAAMLYLDFDAVFNVGKIDRPALERDLDQAEYWLCSWVAPALRILTLGWVNPRQMVHDEVLKALTHASWDINKMMWWWALQIAMRLAFGLSLWLTWLFLN